MRPHWSRIYGMQKPSNHCHYRDGRLGRLVSTNRRSSRRVSRARLSRLSDFSMVSFKRRLIHTSSRWASIMARLRFRTNFSTGVNHRFSSYSSSSSSSSSLGSRVTSIGHSWDPISRPEEAHRETDILTSQHASLGLKPASCIAARACRERKPKLIWRAVNSPSTTRTEMALGAAIFFCYSCLLHV